MAIGRMRTSPNGLGLIKLAEGFVNTIYLDQVGKPTIGYGHLLTADENASGQWDNGYPPLNGKPNGGPPAISQDAATALLASDVADAEQAVNDLVTVDLNQNQFDALVDLVYNIGRHNFSISSLLRKLNQGDYAGAADSFAVWNKGHDPSGQLVVIDNLNRRRARESALFMKASDDSTPDTFNFPTDDLSSDDSGNVTPVDHTARNIAIGVGAAILVYLLLKAR